MKSVAKKQGPPKSRLVVRVGVTGHRPNGLEGADLCILKDQINQVLSVIKESVQNIFADISEFYAGSAPVLRLISPLAEGSDRMAAHEALKLGYELQCPLPFERQLYEKDFEPEESRKEFNNLLEQASAILEINGSAAHRDNAYNEVGKMVLTQCDLLLAIWDGNESRGTGGTAQVVKTARSYNIPTIRIHAAKPHGIEMYKIDKAWETFVFEHLRENLSPDDLMIPMILKYFAEKQRKANLGFPYILFRNLVGDGRIKMPKLRLADFEMSTANEWNSEIWSKSADFPSEMIEQIEKGFIRYYAWADKLADYYANLYRTSFLINYICSGLAVLCALLSYAIQSHNVLWPIVTEVLLIFLIILVTFLNKKHQWHQCWIDYRILAELLRTMKYLAPLGQVTSSFRVPAHASVDDIRSSWVNWYFNSVVRETGLMNIKIDNQYLQAYRLLIKEGEIKGQSDFHKNNKERYHRINHRLHFAGYLLFTITFVAALGHLFYHGELNHLLTVVAAVCPALGAASTGILFQGEYERLELRSEAMFSKLSQLYLTDNQQLVTFQDIQRLATDSADCMLTEVMDWHYLFKARPLNLPS